VAQFTLSATAANGQRIADIEALQQIAFSLADKRVTFADAKADLARISVQALPLAWAQPALQPLVVDSGDLSLRLTISAEADGSRVRVDSPEPVSLRNVTIRNGNEKIVDQLNLTAKPQLEYTADRLQARVSEINGTMATGDTLAGTVTADITHLSGARSIAFTAETTAKVVAALKPYLPADVAPLTVVSSSQGKLDGQLLRFERSSTSVSRTPGGRLMNFELVQPLVVDLKTNSFAAAKPEASAARLQLSHVPLAWANKVVTGGNFNGEVASGTLEIALRSADDLGATTVEPITLHAATVAMNGQAMLQNVDATVDFKASKHGDTIAYDVRKLEAKQGTGALVTLVCNGEAKLAAKPTIAAKGTLEADAAALMQQPAFAAGAALARGQISATFDANIGEATIQANAKVTGRGLVAKQDNRALGDAEIMLTTTVQADGSSLVKVPFTLTNGGRKSDVTIDGKVVRSSNSVSFDGRITSKQVFVEDLQPLAGLAPSAGPSPASSSPNTPATNPAAASRSTAARPALPVASSSGAGQPISPANTRDTKPFWSGFGGTLDVDFKEVTVNRDYVVSGLRGNAAVSATHLGLNALQGQLKENPFKLSATLDFDGSKPQPYTLASAADFSNVDIGEILRAANPGEKPQVETKVTVSAKLDAQGATLNDTLQHAYGKFDVSGSQGVLRALAKRGGKAVTGVSTLLGIAGAAQNSEGTVALGELTKKLAELPFDKFVMHAERGADLNIKVTQLDFLSADTHVSGSGMIVNQPGVPVQNQSMQFTIQIAGKDSMGLLMQRARILGDQTDALGYRNMFTSFTLKGTPANADSSDLWRILGEAVMRNFGDQLGNQLQKLLGR
jgi:hypothetical protein